MPYKPVSDRAGRAGRSSAKACSAGCGRGRRRTTSGGAGSSVFHVKHRSSDRVLVSRETRGTAPAECAPPRSGPATCRTQRVLSTRGAAPRRGEVATRAPHPPVETFHVKHRVFSNSWRGNAVEDPQPRNGASPFGVLTRRPRGAEGVGLGRAMHLCRPRSDRRPGSRPQRGKAPFHVKQLPERGRSGRGRHSRGTEPLSPAHPSACGVRSGRCWSPHAKGARAARRDEGTVSRETRRVRRCWSAPPFHVNSASRTDEPPNSLRCPA